MGFRSAVEHILAVEGGYVNHPTDPGGETNFGISKRAYPHLDIKNLTREQAIAIYHRDYWRPLGAEGLDERLAFLAFDAAVNHGLGRARSWLRDYPTFSAFLAARLRFYVRLNAFSTFGRGWINRMATILDATNNMPPLPGSEAAPVPASRRLPLYSERNVLLGEVTIVDDRKAYLSDSVRASL